MFKDSLTSFIGTDKVNLGLRGRDKNLFRKLKESVFLYSKSQKSLYLRTEW